MNEKLNEWVFLSGQDITLLRAAKKSLGDQGRASFILEPELDARYNLSALLACHEVMFFPDWQNSRECCLHHKVALELGMKCVYVPVPGAPKW